MAPGQVMVSVNKTNEEPGGGTDPGHWKSHGRPGWDPASFRTAGREHQASLKSLLQVCGGVPSVSGKKQHNTRVPVRLLLGASSPPSRLNHNFNLVCSVLCGVFKENKSLPIYELTADLSAHGRAAGVHRHGQRAGRRG